MRIAGAVTIAAALMIGAFFLLAPTSISVLGFSGSCGAPIAAVHTHSPDTATDSILAECRAQSSSRIYTGLGVGIVGIVAGVAMQSADPGRPGGFAGDGGAPSGASSHPYQRQPPPRPLPESPEFLAQRAWRALVRRAERRWAK